jgi:ribonuclease HII
MGVTTVSAAQATVVRASRKPAHRTSAKRRPRYESVDAGFEIESLLAASGCSTIAGIDEVGRGAWAGPLTVGVAVMTARRLGRLPAGLRDSKLLAAEQRQQLFRPVCRSLLQHAIGHASPNECDELGMVAAQRLATRRALDSLVGVPDAVIFDGPYDFTDGGEAVCVVDADRLCAVVAAASVLAKVTRDALMVEASADFPGYSFEHNKGYASPEHRLAVSRLGKTSIHRMSWAVNIPEGDDWAADEG